MLLLNGLPACCWDAVFYFNQECGLTLESVERILTDITMHVASSILESIGSTPIAQLRKVVPPGSARVLAKLEWANPTGSMKDRMAKAVIERAEADGRLRDGGTVVEYTGGTTGISLALACAAKGYHFHAVFSDAFSEEKRLTMKAFGA